MKNYWLIAFIGLLPFGLWSCNSDTSHPKTPSAVVETLFERVEAIKEAAKQAKEDDSTEEVAKDLAKSKTDLNDLFLNQDKAKLLMMPLAFIKSEQVEFIEETIEGDHAEVTIEHTVVVGLGLDSQLAQSAQQRRQVSFQLKKEKGRWMISDIGGVLGRFGR